jgi:small ligand-binding sensory domain FIST
MAALALSLPRADLRPWSVTPNEPLDLSDEDAVRGRLGPTNDTALLLADPFSTPTPQLIEAMNRPVVGALASGASQAGHNRLFLDDFETNAGAIGVTLGGVDVQTVVSQGCSGIGDPLVVTRSKDNVILELGGQPPMAVLKSIALSMDEDRRKLMNKGLLIGVVIDEYKDHHGRGDFLIRNVTQLDTKNGVIAVGDRVRVGQTIQFHVRDVTTADEDLDLLLAGQQFGDEPLAALVFSCNSRGKRLFAEPHHDTRLIRKRLGSIPIAGLFAAGEIGPIGGQSYLHGHTLAMAVIR